MKRDWRLAVAASLQLLALILAFNWFYAAIEHGVRYEIEGASIANTFPTALESYAFFSSLLCAIFSIGLTIWAWLRPNDKNK